MKELQTFNNKEFGKIRTVIIDNVIYFVGKDVAEILGYNNTRDALAKRVEDEDKVDGVAICDSIGREQKPILINESGLYSLVLSSKLPTAKKFKRWVTSEVLPAIQKHGMYAVDELLNNPDMAIKAFTALKEEREKNKQLQIENDRMKPKEIFADAVSASKQCILVGELAKILKQNGIDTGEKRLYTWLREQGYLIKRKGIDYNMPTQKSMELGLFEIGKNIIMLPNGETRVNKTAKVTGRGQQYFIQKFLNENRKDSKNETATRNI